MDAIGLFREGVSALRDQQDIERARKLLTQSLDLDANNEMAWLWLAQTIDDPKLKMDHIERALRLNPQNEMGLALRAKLLSSPHGGSGDWMNKPAPKPKPTIQQPKSVSKPKPPAPKPAPPAAPDWNFGSQGNGISMKPPAAYDDADATDPAPLLRDAQTTLPPVNLADLPTWITDSPVGAGTREEPRQPAAPAIKQVAAKPAPLPAPAAKPTLAPPAPAPAAKPAQTITLPKPAYPARNVPEPPVISDEERVADLLKAADDFMKRGDLEAALDKWVHVLEIDSDHEVAMQHAVRGLFKLGYPNDVYELVMNAINDGTTSVPIYMTAIDVARHQGDAAEADQLREEVALLPTASEDLTVKMIDHFVEAGQPQRAAGILERKLVQTPKSQRLLLYMGDLQDQVLGEKHEAMHYYERAAQLKSNKRASKQAEQSLRNFTPVESDRERGSMLLAWREALGFGVVFLLLGFQDAGLNLLQMGMARWQGVVLAVLGGYLIVTALSSPQQKPLAALLGGNVPPPPPEPAQPTRPGMYLEDAPASGVIQSPTELPIIPAFLRILLLLGGLALVGVAFVLVFNLSLHLLLNFTPPYIPSVQSMIGE